MDQMCSTCLCTNRFLYYPGQLSQLINTLLCGVYKEKNWSCFVICWECRALLNNANRFVHRAKLAQEFLKNKLSGCENVPTLTSLRFQQNFSFGIELNLPELQEVKIEFTPDTPVENQQLHNENVQSDVECSKSASITVSESITVDSAQEVCNVKTEVSSDDEILADKAVRIQNDESIQPSNEIKPRKQCGQKATLEYELIRMSEADMLAYRERDKTKSFYVQAPFKCATCISGFYDKEKYDMHVNRCHDETAGEFICIVCACRFKTESGLAAHDNQHYGLYSCRACPYTHRKNANIRRHVDSSHGSSRIYKCPVCGQGFLNYSSMNYHREAAHRRASCDECGKSFSTKINLQRHMLLHTSSIPIYECATCNKKLRGKGSYRTHMQTHDSSPVADAYCAECDKQFKSISTYKNHLVTSLKHVDRSNFKQKCPVCEKRFRNKSQLASHYSVVHVKKTDWQCDTCQKYFPGASHLRHHIKRIHNTPRPEKTEQCAFCDKKFINKRYLESHTRTHTGERPFKCATCDATFGHKAALWTHNRLVHLRLKRNKGKRASGDAGTTPRVDGDPL